jgi:hypothetical protein
MVGDTAAGARRKAGTMELKGTPTMNKLFVSLIAAAAACAVPMSAANARAVDAAYPPVPQEMVRIIPVSGPYAAPPLSTHDEYDQRLTIQARAASDPSVESALLARHLTSSAVFDLGTGPGGTIDVYVQG